MPSKVSVSTLRDPGLAPSGHQKIDWVKAHMPILNQLERELSAHRPLAGQRVAMSIHLEAKTAYMALVFAAAGAEVFLTGSNPLSTQDDVAAAAAERGVTVHAWHGATPEEYTAHLTRTLEAARPTLLLDDGGDLTHLLHTGRADLAANLIGGSEETSTGVQRLRAMEAEGVLRFPMVAVNNARMKHLFDNRYGTGQSTLESVMRNTNLSIAGKRVVVAGYGWCGKGVAMRAKGLGARVIVCEVDPVLANEALMDGFEVMPMARAAALGDIFITVTGCEKVIRREHFEVMRDGAILANAGHFDVEIWKPDLEAFGGQPVRVRPHVDAYTAPDGRRLYLIGEGRLANLAAGDGHPAEVMDLSFGVQLLTHLWLVENRGRLENRVIEVPPEIDTRVAETRLRALGVEIDRLTPEQERYIRSWQV
ncbi:adenosylhomocysteinase [Symbiobacterium thermophilum]|uniref:Adenosylhomocysteinase n=1 Tax=Symbiobacterium thermophilum (strain DSM 24528 / JCM 14929 / IAM 14863 / T) TaxID=292459 RepID=Q67NR1_SYMTH|nr:adenosylhomocysteinase [Symbiobacterium thermophilum]BAD40682.1 S-adenosyl-L-homocysteine hydrolase [Symbiobacterium thermophilum IAM 14863]